MVRIALSLLLALGRSGVARGQGVQCYELSGNTCECGPGCEACSAVPFADDDDGGAFDDAGGLNNGFPLPAFHVHDRLGCGLNDPCAPFFDAAHGVYHLFYQVSHSSSVTRKARVCEVVPPLALVLLSPWLLLHCMVVPVLSLPPPTPPFGISPFSPLSIGPRSGPPQRAGRLDRLPGRVGPRREPRPRQLGAAAGRALERPTVRPRQRLHGQRDDRRAGARQRDRLHGAVVCCAPRGRGGRPTPTCVE